MAHDYFSFIAAAYGLSGLAIAALGLWVFLDARGRRMELRALEARGIRRRSVPGAGA